MVKVFKKGLTNSSLCDIIKTTKKEREKIKMLEHQKEELWSLLLEWKDDILEEYIGRNVNADSIEEVIEKIEKIIKE